MASPATATRASQRVRGDESRRESDQGAPQVVAWPPAARCAPGLTRQIGAISGYPLLARGFHERRGWGSPQLLWEVTAATSGIARKRRRSTRSYATTWRRSTRPWRRASRERRCHRSCGESSRATSTAACSAAVSPASSASSVASSTWWPSPARAAAPAGPELRRKPREFAFDARREQLCAARKVPLSGVNRPSLSPLG
jgi:hypothetical protein